MLKKTSPQAVNTPPPGCVVYIPPTTFTPQDDLILRAAQREALSLQVPLVVICVIETPQKDEQFKTLASLRAAERWLHGYGIPLMALFGSPEGVLEPTYEHIQPVAIFTKQSAGDKDDIPLKKHPYRWPGVILSMRDLEAHLRVKNIAC